MSTVQALRAADEHLAEEMAASLDESIRKTGRQAGEQQPPDPEANVDQWADILRESVAYRNRCIADTKKEERAFVKSHKAEIKRLEAEIVEAQTDAAAKIEAHEKIVTASKAFLAAVEE